MRFFYQAVEVGKVGFSKVGFSTSRAAFSFHTPTLTAAMNSTNHNSECVIGYLYGYASHPGRLSRSEFCELTNDTVDFGPIFQCWIL